mmetsp:Transcript_13919/g.40030  ORF Transcript_13919/g.40030 Transcript_13919/m.40030 type:complete len:219 (+) Transcript_13919:219-875(+)
MIRNFPCHFNQLHTSIRFTHLLTKASQFTLRLSKSRLSLDLDGRNVFINHRLKHRGKPVQELGTSTSLRRMLVKYLSDLVKAKEIILNRPGLFKGRHIDVGFFQLVQLILFRCSHDVISLRERILFALDDRHNGIFTTDVHLVGFGQNANRALALRINISGQLSNALVFKVFITGDTLKNDRLRRCQIGSDKFLDTIDIALIVLVLGRLDEARQIHQG